MRVHPRVAPECVPLAPGPLHRTAQLFRSFGEDHHERMLEEQHIFPVIRKMNQQLARYADILIAQHRRGREVTDYILAVTGGAKIAATHTTPLARVCEGFVRMYETNLDIDLRT